MRVTIMPGKANGNIQAPPSKSMAHRMLIGAGLAGGISIIDNIDLSEDVRATLGVLETLGGRYFVDAGKVMMQGVGDQAEKMHECSYTDKANPIPIVRKLDCNESGSTLRFFIPIALALGIPCEFVGAKRLFERPLSVYEKICEEQGILFEKSESGLKVDGQLKAGRYQVKGDISSQFITGLLFALPLLHGDSVLEVLPPVESKPYIDMTLETLKIFGITVHQDGNVFDIPGKQRYKVKFARVEGDYSNAAFLDAFNLIGGNVKVEGLREDSLQGDRIYREYFCQLSANCVDAEREKNEVQHANSVSYPVMNISECPDLGPILMGLAAAGHGAKFTGTRRLRMKESDRGTAMAEELAKFGVQVDVFDNEIIVYDCELQKPSENLNSHNDHRIAMTLATLCSITGGTIEGAESVRKSFPNYYEVIQSLGIALQLEDGKQN